jgi:hypothetical protein
MNNLIFGVYCDRCKKSIKQLRGPCTLKGTYLTLCNQCWKIIKNRIMNIINDINI